VSVEPHPNTEIPTAYDVERGDFGKIRLYYGLRAVLFLACMVVCGSALTANDLLSDPTRGMLSGLVLFFGLFVALKYSKPLIGYAFGISPFRIPISVWHGLSVIMALAYAADGWNYIDKSVAYPVLGIAGLLFFGIPCSIAMKLLLKPASGGAMIQMARESTAMNRT